MKKKSMQREDLLKMDHSKNPKRREKAHSIPFNQFKHTSSNRFPEEPRPFFQENREVCYYYGGNLHDDRCGSVNLKSAAQKMAYEHSRDSKVELLGSDLYHGWERFEPMSPQVLDSSIGCFKWMHKWEKDNGESYAHRSKFVIISPRHYLVDLTMQLFQRQKFSLLCTSLGDGRILLSQADHPKVRAPRNNGMSKRILYSGYALEDLLTEGPRLKDDPFFAIMEAKLDSDISLVLRCEIDSYNQLTGTFTELKCYAPLSMHNLYHREKLLKTWIQLGLSPPSDLLIGVRNTQLGQLQDLQYFSKQQLYKKINNRDLPPCRKKFNYNADIAVQWLQHCLRAICKLVGEADTSKGAHCFELTIDEGHKISINKLPQMPAKVKLATLEQINV